MHHKRRSRRSDSRYDCDWSATSRARKMPYDGEICNGKSKAHKPRPKKDKCPVNRTHEWYKERITETERYWSEWLYPESGWREVTYVYDKWTCIHCWTEKTKRVRQQYEWRKNRKLVLKKRAVKF